jgi:hypothetical protein
MEGLPERVRPTALPMKRLEASGVRGTVISNQ